MKCIDTCSKFQLHFSILVYWQSYSWVSDVKWCSELSVLEKASHNRFGKFILKAGFVAFNSTFRSAVAFVRQVCGERRRRLLPSALSACIDPPLHISAPFMHRHEHNRFPYNTGCRGNWVPIRREIQKNASRPAALDLDTALFTTLNSHVLYLTHQQLNPPLAAISICFSIG